MAMAMAVALALHNETGFHGRIWLLCLSTYLDVNRSRNNNALSIRSVRYIWLCFFLSPRLFDVNIVGDTAAVDPQINFLIFNVTQRTNVTQLRLCNCRLVTFCFFLY